MSTSICNSFESNAWRNDLCSHCFQSKEEHGKTDLPVNTTRYQSVLTHRPSFILRQLKVEQQQQQRPPSGILNLTRNSKVKKSVKYCEDEDEVIGYGGQEVFEEDSEEDLGEDLEDDEDEEDLPFTEEERQVKYLFILKRNRGQMYKSADSVVRGAKFSHSVVIFLLSLSRILFAVLFI